MIAWLQEGKCKYGKKCKFDHPKRDAPDAQPSNAPRNESSEKKSSTRDKATIKCFACGKNGHYARDCRASKEAKDKYRAQYQKEK